MKIETKLQKAKSLQIEFDNIMAEINKEIKPAIQAKGIILKFVSDKIEMPINTFNSKMKKGTFFITEVERILKVIN